MTMQTRLVLAMRRAHLNSAELALISFTTQSEIDDLLSGKVSRSVRIFQIANALRVNPRWLTAGEGEMVPEKPPAGTRDHYDTDFYGWTQKQAAFIASLVDVEGLDTFNLSDEIASLGRYVRRELRQHLQSLFAELLKWCEQPLIQCRKWQLEITGHRNEIGDLLADNASLCDQLPELTAFAYERARETAAIDTGLALEVFPERCPWTYDEAMTPDYYPNHRDITE